MSEYGDNLTKEFQETANKINAKIEEARLALSEANRLAYEAGLTGLIHTQWTEFSDEMEENFDKNLDEDDDAYDILSSLYEMIDVSNFESTLFDSGWQTSSSYC